MKPSCRHAVAALALLGCSAGCAAAYPTEFQLRAAIGNVAGLLKAEGLELAIFDARKEGMTEPLLASALTLIGDACFIFYNTKPENGLVQFFDSFGEKDLTVMLNALAVHEAAHCFEQREALVHKRFAKVLPADFERDTATTQGYISVVKSGALITWNEALADIAALLYLKRAAPGRWEYFAYGLAAMRRELAAKWPEHDTSAWLYTLIAADAGLASNQSLFEEALQLRRQYRPGR